MKDFLAQWDQSSKKQRAVILDRFVEHFECDAQESRVSRLDYELGEICPLFFSRLMSSLQINHAKPSLVSRHLAAIAIYLQSQRGKQYATRFLNAGGMQLLLFVLRERRRYAAIVQTECLRVVRIVMRSQTNFKEMLCVGHGVDLLLAMLREADESDDADLLYALYDLLKQLCIRNEVFAPSIHQSIIDCVADYAKDVDDADGVRAEAVKAMLKVLAGTLCFSFSDDRRRGTAATKPSTRSRNVLELESAASTTVSSLGVAYVDIDVLNESNAKLLLRLLTLQNHQISYEVQTLCDVVMRSERAQAVWLRCLLAMRHEAKDEVKETLTQFIQTLADANRHILSESSMAILSEAHFLLATPLSI